MKFDPTAIQGVYMITLPKFEDSRGSFVKTFHETTFKNRQTPFELKESYFSISHKNVVRGMHFQIPPHEHEKIVFCPKGRITDVILDIRKNSSTFGQHITMELSQDNCKAIYIPKGCAHGFISREDDSITYYLVSSEHNPEQDTGILYNSFGMDWACKNPVLSNRDLSFLKLMDFESPF